MRRPLLLCAPLAAACGAPAPEPAEACAACLLEDTNNFAYTSELTLGTLAVPELADTVLRWDALTQDLRGEPLDPATITEARLVAFRTLTAEEIAYGLSHDTLEQADVGAYVTCTPHDARCALSEFGMFGNTVDIQEYFEEGYATWLLVLGGEGVSAVDQLALLTPRADATETEVAVRDDTSALEAEVDLGSLTPVRVDPFTDALSLDWSGLTRDGRGDPLNLDTVDELWIASFEEAPDELAARAFDLESLAERAWTMDVADTLSADLSLLEGDTEFLGVDRDTTWVAALRCLTCTNPAPRFLTFLEAVDR